MGAITGAGWGWAGEATGAGETTETVAVCGNIVTEGVLKSVEDVAAIDTLPGMLGCFITWARLP